MLVLPGPPRRSWIRAFWLALSLTAGLAAGLPLAVLEGRAGLLAGAALAALLAAPGLLQPQAVRLPYKAWNRLARLYARLARPAFLVLAYAVIVAVGVLGSRLRLRPEAGSLWQPRRTIPSPAYSSQHAGIQPSTGRRPWPLGLAAWAAGTGNGWTLALLPCLLLLAAVEPEERELPPPDIYTLF